MNLKKRLVCLAVSLVMLCSTVAVHASEYVDMPEDYWAYSDMVYAAQLGIITGTGEGEMSPEQPLSWAQCLTLLVRAFAPEQYQAAIASGFSWDQAGWQTALLEEYVLPDDFLPVSAGNLSDTITRREMAVLLDRALPEEIHSYRLNGSAQSVFSDWDALGEDYQASVDRLYGLSIVNGKSDGTFGAFDSLQRADGCVLILRTLKKLDQSLSSSGVKKQITLQFLDQDGNALREAVAVEARIGDYIFPLVDEYAPENYTTETDLSGGWFHDGALSVSSACSQYAVTLRPMTWAEIQDAWADEQYEQFWEKVENGELSYEDLYWQDFLLKTLGENEKKHALLFGDRDKRRFENQEEAEANMVSITVPAWKISGGKKVTSSVTLTVNQALASDVTEIFTEIYNDPEQFPIESVGAYAWRGDSATGEHNCGTAIDVNAEENYQVRNGQALVGSFWLPGENEYSITAQGSVVRIFAQHGWSWGGDTWNNGDSDSSYGYHDYMHFSYMGM